MGVRSEFYGSIARNNEWKDAMIVIESENAMSKRESVFDKKEVEHKGKLNEPIHRQ